MPFNDNLPAEGTDPWYAPLVTAWTNLKAFVNALETALTGKSDVGHTHAAGDVVSGTFTQVRIPDLNASKIASGVLDVARIPDLPTSKVTGLDTALTSKALASDLADFENQALEALDDLSDVVATKASTADMTAALSGKANSADLDNVFAIANAALPAAEVAGFEDAGWVRGIVIGFDAPEPVGLPDFTLVIRLPEA